ncbi:hypothetical protein EV182_007732, partial [Spiromyces aspiralis]
MADTPQETVTSLDQLIRILSERFEANNERITALEGCLTERIDAYNVGHTRVESIAEPKTTPSVGIEHIRPDIRHAPLKFAAEPTTTPSVDVEHTRLESADEPTATPPADEPIATAPANIRNCATYHQAMPDDQRFDLAPNVAHPRTFDRIGHCQAAPNETNGKTRPPDQTYHEPDNADTVTESDEQASDGHSSDGHLNDERPSDKHATDGHPISRVTSEENISD